MDPHSGLPAPAPLGAATSQGEPRLDSLPAPPAPPGFAAPRTFWPLCIAVVVLPLAIAAAAAWASWVDLHADAEARLTHTVDLLHEHTLRGLESQEAYLTAVNRFIIDLDWPAIAASADVADFLVQLRDSAPGTSAIGLISPAGQLVQTSSFAFPMRPIDLSQRDYFLAQQGVGPNEVTPKLGAALIGRVRGRMVFPLSHPRRDREGRPDGGVIWATSDIRAFAAFYTSIVVHPADSVQLIRRDGSILAKHPPDAATEDARLRGAKLAVIEAAARRDGVALAYTREDSALPASDRSILPALRADRLVASRWLDRYDVAIAYGLSLEPLHRAWIRAAGGFAAAAGVVALLLLALIRLAQLGMKREYAALMRARSEAERRLEAEVLLHRTARITALGQIAAGAAHDMNNLIQSVLAASRLIERRAEQPEQVRRLSAMLQGTAARGGRIAGRMLEYSRRSSTGPDREVGESLDVAVVLGRLEEMVGGLLGSGIRLAWSAEPNLPPLQADRAEFETVLLNLIVNARDAMPEGGEVRVTAGLAESEHGTPRLRVTVEDTGIGMPLEVLRRAGEPFFTTKEAGRGTGLGLSMARQFAEGLGGSLGIQSKPGLGTRVSLWLPA
ncbi:ATP-binding protein [Falsiroseomonas tokyonensis]|uniref:histidine kinase n=1 Tax=Falsiroseomonas tokyonensis TaxID=430521 RepID=A0ABV7BX36_9PROT|nr:ATP-binding protein [Falsiroseomonas tokyonensis]MBU8540093.1 hypothetical protein [Falsiroseomonas tokyonensis]